MSEAGLLEKLGRSTRGALTFLTDPEFGEEISDGHHSYYTLQDGTIIGVLGAMGYILDENGRRLNEGYHEYYLLGDKTLLGVMGRAYTLNANGRRLSLLGSQEEGMER